MTAKALRPLATLFIIFSTLPLAATVFSAPKTFTATCACSGVSCACASKIDLPLDTAFAKATLSLSVAQTDFNTTDKHVKFFLGATLIGTCHPNATHKSGDWGFFSCLRDMDVLTYVQGQDQFYFSGILSPTVSSCCNYQNVALYMNISLTLVPDCSTSACSTCHTCNGNENVMAACTMTEDTVCACPIGTSGFPSSSIIPFGYCMDCDPGTFADIPGMIACANCTTCKSATEYQATECSKTTDTSCACLYGARDGVCIVPSVAATPSTTTSPTASPSRLSSRSASPSLVSRSQSPSATRSPTRSPSTSASASRSAFPSASKSRSLSISITPSSSPTSPPTPSKSSSTSATSSRSLSRTNSLSPTTSRTPTRSPSGSKSTSMTASESPSPSLSIESMKSSSSSTPVLSLPIWIAIAGSGFIFVLVSICIVFRARSTTHDAQSLGTAVGSLANQNLRNSQKQTGQPQQVRAGTNGQQNAGNLARAPTHAPFASSSRVAPSQLLQQPGNQQFPPRNPNPIPSQNNNLQFQPRRFAPQPGAI